MTVFDVTSSTLVSEALVGRIGAKSGLWIPMIADERVVGVLAVASTDVKRTFTSDELALLQAMAVEAGLSIERLRSAVALSAALGREQAITEIARRVRAELNAADVIRVAREQIQRALQVEHVEILVDGENANVEIDRAV